MKLTMGDVLDSVKDSFNTAGTGLSGRKGIVYFESEDESLFTELEIVEGGSLTAVGVHLVEPFESKIDFEFRLFNAVESALRDSFPRIVIHHMEIKN
jgi:hypothetical protein